jgi:hypothetical protein
MTLLHFRRFQSSGWLIKLPQQLFHHFEAYILQTLLGYGNIYAKESKKILKCIFTMHTSKTK